VLSNTNKQKLHCNYLNRIIFQQKQVLLLSLVAQRFKPNLREPAAKTNLKLKLHASRDEVTLHLSSSENQNGGASYPGVIDIPGVSGSSLSFSNSFEVPDSLVLLFTRASVVHRQKRIFKLSV